MTDKLLLLLMIFFTAILHPELAKAFPDTNSVFEPVKVIQLVSKNSRNRQYTESLSTLLYEIGQRTSVDMDFNPIEIETLTDPALSKHTLLYINIDSFDKWSLSSEETEALKKFIDLGGFVFLDAGIKSEFLRASNSGIHSFADWEARPEVTELFSDIYPDKEFMALARNHPVFHTVYSGLPDAAQLPEAIRDFVVNEKWPGGTYSLVGLEVNNRLAVIAAPVMAMGWGKDETGNWIYQIDFRVREGSEQLSERLSLAAYSGDKFEANRADGLVDIVYTHKNERPGWVQEPDGQFRVFKYYSGPEISDFAHSFYTRLGINIFVFALLD